MSKHNKHRNYEQERNYMNSRGLSGGYPYNNMNNGMNPNMNNGINPNMNPNMNNGINPNMNNGMNNNMGNNMNANMDNSMNNGMNNNMNNGVPYNNIRPNNMMGNFMNSINNMTGLGNNGTSFNGGMNGNMNNGNMNNGNMNNGIKNILQSLSANPILQLLTNLDFNLLSKILFGTKAGNTKINNENIEDKEPSDIQNNLRDILKNLDEGEISNLIKHVAPEEISYIISKLNISKDLNSNLRHNLDHVINSNFAEEGKVPSEGEVGQNNYPASAILEVVNTIITQNNKQFVDRVMNIYNNEYKELNNSVNKETVDIIEKDAPIDISEENIVDIDDPLEDYSLSS